MPAFAVKSTKNFRRLMQVSEFSTNVISDLTPTIKSVSPIRTRAEPLVESNTPVSKKIGL